eukprot:UN07433
MKYFRFTLKNLISIRMIVRTIINEYFDHERNV